MHHTLTLMSASGYVGWYMFCRFLQNLKGLGSYGETILQKPVSPINFCKNLKNRNLKKHWVILDYYKVLWWYLPWFIPCNIPCNFLFVCRLTDELKWVFTIENSVDLEFRISYTGDRHNDITSLILSLILSPVISISLNLISRIKSSLYKDSQ